MNIEIDEKEFEGKHNFLSELLLQPGCNMVDSNRGQMFTSHINQVIQITESEPPLMFSGFENQVSKYSTGYCKLEGKNKLLKKIYKNKYNYVAIFQNIDTGEYHIKFRTECVHFTEHFGKRNNNEFFDSMVEGDIIEDKIIYTDMNYDSHYNQQIGTNANVVYLTYKGYTNEDGIVISDELAERMSSYFVRKIKVHVNTNDLLLNLFGNKEEYKCIPDIGTCIDGKLLSRRRINYNKVMNDLVNLQDSNLEDDNYYAKGMVVDIDIFSNNSIENLEKQIYSKQQVDIINNNNRYYNEYVTFLKPIVENKKNKYSKELFYYYNRYKTFLNKNIKFEVDGNIFDNYIIIMTTIEKRPLIAGSKITGRYGNKSVISKILPKDEMPVFEKFDNGDIRKDTKVSMRADIIMSPHGVINRLNPQQLIEVEINYIGKVIRYRMEGLLIDNHIEEAKNLFLKFIKSCNENQYNSMKDFINTLDSKQIKDLLWEAVEKGIPIHQPPFRDNINIDKLESIYDEFNVNESKCKNIETPLIIGEEYIYRLKHEPSEKFNARSSSQNNLMDLPTKTRVHKDGKDLYSKTPIRIGEYEIPNMYLGKDMDAIKKLLNNYANNKTDRLSFIKESLLNNPFDIKLIDSGTKNINSTVIENLLFAIGLELKEDNKE